MVKMINKMNFSVIFLFLLFCSSTCKKDKNCPKNSHNQIIIQNNSQQVINWRLFTPDSVYRINGSQPAADKILDPNSNDHYNIRQETCWEAEFKDGFVQYFFIFDNDTVQAIGWEQISGTNRGLLKRVKVDLEYLQANNFTVTYP